MKTPNTTEVMPSAVERLDSIGTFPKRKNTVLAGVLAHLLTGHELTSMDAVRGSNTTRLSGAIVALAATGARSNRYHWPISYEDFEVDTADGRVANVRRFWIAPETRQAALLAGAAQWCHDVRLERSQRRMNAERACFIDL